MDGKNKFADIVFDFGYFEKLDANEKRIEDDPVSQPIYYYKPLFSKQYHITIQDIDSFDKRFRDSYIEIIKRFYLAFESIHQYVVDLNSFIEELNDGFYIQQTLETVFQDEEGKQMLVNNFLGIPFVQ